jgi:secondary thiamine-phosphate synthase enzyme
MEIFYKTIEVRTEKAFEFIQVDSQIQEVVTESGIKEGFVLLRSPHNTATITCNEPDASIHRDAQKIMERILPKDFDWEHAYEGVTNARAHQAVMLLFGQTHWLAIKNGKILLGTWQGIFVVELFEARERKVELVIVG